jgi:hypothetical protein
LVGIQTSLKEDQKMVAKAKTEEEYWSGFKESAQK